MPNFTARPTAGVSLITWLDPAASADYCTGTAPSRINPDPAHPHKHYRGTGTEITLKATVGGTEGPADGALGGNLFHTYFSRWPGAAPPLVTFTAGFTSIAKFTPTDTGHYVFVFYRPSGGAVGVHLDVEIA